MTPSVDPPRVSAPPFDSTPCLAQTELFSGLSPAELRRLTEHMQSVVLTRGQTLVRQGDPGDSLYVVLEGRLLVTQRTDRGTEVQLERIGPGNSVGEIAFLTGEQRSASVYAETDATVLGLSRESFERFCLSSPDLVTRLSQIVVKSIQKAELRNLLFTSDQYKDMSHAALQDLEAALELILCPSGGCLIRQGDASDGCYIVVSGRLRMTDVNGNGEPRLIGEISRGQTAGEMSLLTGARRTATVSAIRDTLVARLSTEAFQRLLQAHPQDFVNHFAGRVIDRLWLETVGKARRTGSVVTLAIVPTHAEVCCTEFCRRLARTLVAHGPALHLNSERLDHYLSPAGIAQTPATDPHSANIACWLNRQESGYRYILYQADAGPSEWTDRCLRQADRILLVGHAAASPRIGETEERLVGDPRNRHLPVTLVLLHDTASGSYERTALWLRHRHVQRHYHVCMADSQDLERLARLLTGNGIGLVLSGGGARGFAQIGGIRALTEAGIPVDKVGGTSMGSIIAAMVAMRWDYPKMLEHARSFNYRMDYTYPAVALTAGKVLTRQLKSRLGAQTIEDLRTNFFCVSTDLAGSREHVHERGLLWKSIRASSSIPGLLPPVIEGSQVLVDGGVVNNLPVDIMRKQEDIGSVIAMDVGAPVELETGVPIDGSLSGWAVVTRKLNPFKSSLSPPGIAKILMLSSLTKSARVENQQKNLADLHLTFPLHEFGLLDFHKIQAIVEFGYRYARDRLDACGATKLLNLPH
ncbi:MAG: cyclic nucleotide-binding and patatin-like phospholipase domain-containing protein [Gammaproteobacteria bacterium]